MNGTNPLLTTASLPRYGDIRPDHVLPAVDALIARQQAVVDAIVADRPTDFGSLWLPLERVEAEMDTAWAAVSHLRNVADTPELRAAHAEGQARLVEHETRLGQNRALYELIAALAASPGFPDLPSDDQAAIHRSLRGFVLSGVALEPQDKARFAEIAVELSALTNTFSAAVLDAVEAWSEHVADPDVLRGVPASDMEMFRVAAAEKELEGWLVTLRQPSVMSILTFAEDRSLRQRVHRANGVRASELGPDPERLDNGPRITRILELRAEAARLLGFETHVERSLFTKTAESGEQVLAFLQDLATRARPHAESELAEVRAFAAAELGIGDLQPWDVTFASNSLRTTRLSIDESEVRGYFPVDRVVDGWKVLLTDLFGITLVERTDVPLWHPDAVHYDVADEDGTVFGGLILDLHARAGKRGGAWVSQARPNIGIDGDRLLPVAFVTCNFAPIGGSAPPLLSHDDVTTLLHETGHALQQIFTTVDRPLVGGSSGYEWDAIELPSQLMEDFAWDRRVLGSMSGHHETGAALPDDLFDRMAGARTFQSGLFLLRQIELATFDLRLHAGDPKADPMAVLNAVRDKVAVLRPPEWHRQPHAFGHIFSGAYAAGYYSYLWAELLAADAFGEFVGNGTVDRATGDRLRREILSKGSTIPAIDGFRAFMGREADPAAMLRRHGLIG